MTRNEYLEFRAERRETGKSLDPEKATVYSKFVLELDPYGVISNFVPEVVSRTWFVFTPETGEIAAHDLPDDLLIKLGFESWVNYEPFVPF